MGTVVSQVNRLPHLILAVLRRFRAILVCQYFDDEFVMDVGCMASTPRHIHLRLNDLWGIRYSEHTERFVITTCTYVLGNAYDWCDWIAQMVATFGVKFATRGKSNYIVMGPYADIR